MRKHLVWFPFLLVALTIVLAVLIYGIDRSRNRPPAVVQIEDVLDLEEGEGVDIDAYHDQMRALLQPLWPDGSDADVNEAGRAEQVLSDVLDLRVPGSERDAHIKVVAALNALIESLDGDDEAFAEAQVRFAELERAYEWLRP